MPRCDCAGSTCQCLIQAGEGIQITGSGNTNNPYVVTSTATIAGSLQVQDTRTVDMSAVGAGTPGDPFILSATARIAMEDITNVTGAPPTIGDTLSWNGSSWEMAAPPVVPPGAVNVGAGLLGTGAVDNPVRAAVSGVWGQPPLDAYGTDSTVGREIYVDANGQLRSRPISTTELSVPWDNIIGRPSAFPTTWDTVTGKPTSFPSSWTTLAGRPVILTGWYTVAQLAPGATHYQALTFPAGTFPGQPVVIAQSGNAGSPAAVVVQSATSARIGLQNITPNTTSSQTVMWMAIWPPTSV